MILLKLLSNLYFHTLIGKEELECSSEEGRGGGSQSPGVGGLGSGTYSEVFPPSHPPIAKLGLEGCRTMAGCLDTLSPYGPVSQGRKYEEVRRFAWARVLGEDSKIKREG